MEDIMKVIFRKDKRTKDIVAFLPEVSVNYGNIMSYMHIGQHSEASYDYYCNGTERAYTEEFLPLFQELKNRYDDEILRIKSRLHYEDLVNIAWK